MIALDLQRACYWKRPSSAEIVAANVVLAHGECDFIAILRSGYFHEYEIKISKSDFLADRRKFVATGFEREPLESGGYRWNRVGVLKHDLLTGAAENKDGIALPKMFWFVAPPGILTAEDIPSHCGFLEARPDRERVSLRTVKEAPALRSAVKLSPAQQRRILVNQAWKFMQRWATQPTEAREQYAAV